MVRVHVGADHPGDLFILEEASEQLLPYFPGAGQVQAGVDHYPAVVVLQQPDVDVVQPHGHGEADPVDSLGDLLWHTGLGVDGP